MYDERPRRRRRPISANHLYSHHQHTNPCVFIHLAIGFFRSMVFVFIHVRPLCDFFAPILSATFKRFIYDTVIHTTRPYRIDGGELSRYTTPYLNSYGLVGPFTLRPALHVLLSLIAWTSNNASLIIINIHRRFSICFLLTWATSNALFSFLCICHYHIIISSSIRRFFWTVAASQFVSG